MTANRIRNSKVHRTVAGKANDEVLMLDSAGSMRQHTAASRGVYSVEQSIRSRISGKETADSKFRRSKLGPGDEQMLKI